MVDGKDRTREARKNVEQRGSGSAADRYKDAARRVADLED